MCIHVYVCVYICIYIHRKRTTYKTPFAYNLLFLLCQINVPLFDMGFFCGASGCSRARLAPGCLTYARSERHHQCKLGEPACTSFGGSCQQRRPLELSFFAITLQSKSKVDDVVPRFFVLDRIVSKRNMKKFLLKIAFPVNIYTYIYICIRICVCAYLYIYIYVYT